jgi:cation transport protein ChaC
MSLTRSDLEKGRLQEMIVQSNPTASFLSEAELQASLSNTLQQQQPDSDVWLFAYGSLIWNPVFKFVERRVGTITGSIDGSACGYLLVVALQIILD